MTVNFHLAPAVPPVVPTALTDLRDVVGGTLNAERGKPELEPAMSAAEISRRARDFVELRESGLLRRRA